MHASNSRTTAPGWRPMARFSFPTEPRTCERHGDFLDLKMPAGWAGCPRCNGERIAREDAGRPPRPHRRIGARWPTACSAARPFPRFADKRLDNFAPHAEARGALELARRYADGFGAEAAKSGASLVFCGGVGAGKTHLAVGIAHRLMEQGRIAVFTSVINAIRRVKDTYRRDSGLSEAQVVAGFIRPDLLILDEVGVQFGSETEKMILFEIINGRYEQLKPTIVISNLGTRSPTTWANAWSTGCAKAAGAC